ncbi:hypothetical protein [Wolbachia endosymbiont of Nasonia giraulti]|uniref:hypothetical protein n=1 Tax=Wolbachia endosymbiont of Nasonia giraulti TaxID=180838 RepID=UPI003A855AB1
MTTIILTKLTTQGIRSGVWQNKVKVNLQQQGVIPVLDTGIQPFVVSLKALLLISMIRLLVSNLDPSVKHWNDIIFTSIFTH